MALSPLLASITGEASAGPVVLAVVAAVTLFAAFAPSVRRCLGRSLLCLGAAIFLLPLSTLVLSGVTTHQTIAAAASDAEVAGAAVGGAIAGGVMTGLAGLIGFFFGGVILLFGLILSLGDQREVVVVHR